MTLAYRVQNHKTLPYMITLSVVLLAGWPRQHARAARYALQRSPTDLDPSRGDEMSVQHERPKYEMKSRGTQPCEVDKPPRSNYYKTRTMFRPIIP